MLEWNAICNAYHRFVLMPMASGKTTLATTYPDFVFDVDDARSPALETKLKPYRERRDWHQHNAIWWPAIAAWASSRPAGVILAHGWADAHAMGAKVACTAGFLLPERIWAARVAARMMSAEDRSLARLNRDVVISDVALHHLHTITSDHALLDWIRRPTLLSLRRS